MRPEASPSCAKKRKGKGNIVKKGRKKYDVKKYGVKKYDDCNKATHKHKHTARREPPGENATAAIDQVNRTPPTHTRARREPSGENASATAASACPKGKTFRRT